MISPERSEKMEEMLRVLVEHRANFSVEFFVRHQKIRVRKTGIWDREKLWDVPVFRELLDRGYQHFNVSWQSTGSTPLATVEYQIDLDGDIDNKEGKNGFRLL